MWLVVTGIFHITIYRYVVGSNRVIFMLTDGSKAWEVKDYLVQQDNCEEVTIEGKNYPGKGANRVNKLHNMTRGCCGRDHMVVEFTTTYAITAYHH